MRFLGGKSRKEFEDMAEKDEYIREAYEDLKKLSLDEQKRLEYEVRQKAIRDYNSQMKSAERRGEKRGIELGEKRGIEIGEKRGIEIGTQSTLKRLVRANAESGKSLEEIADCRRRIRTKKESSAGCVFSEGRAGRSLRTWQRRTSISERHMKT